MPDWLKGLMMALLRIPAEPIARTTDSPDVHVFRAAPGFFRYRFVVWLVTQSGTLLGITLFIFFGIPELKGEGVPTQVAWGIELLALTVMLLQVPFSLLLLRLDYELRWYTVSSRSLHIREGVWHLREMTMTFANIQNISISQGPIQRLFGISDLKVQTAGGGGQLDTKGGQQQGADLHLGYFRGVSNAEEIRSLMLELLRQYRTAGLGDGDEPAVTTDGDGLDEDSLTALRALRAETAALRGVAEAASAT